MGLHRRTIAGTETKAQAREPSGEGAGLSEDGDSDLRMSDRTLQHHVSKGDPK